MTHDITKAVRAGIESDRDHGAVVPPLHLSSNFTFEGFDRKRTYDYTRSGNPTRDLLATALAELEGGHGAVVTSSGMSAIALVLQLLEPGDLLLAPIDGYGGTYRALTRLARKEHFDLVFYDPRHPEQLDAYWSQSPRMVWIETPSNPLMRLSDIRSIAASARAASCTVVVDNTFASPALQNPIRLGADLVVHSTTKYLNGHSDVVGGAVVAASAEQHDELVAWANCLGLTGSPFDSYLTLRGLRTLHARIATHEQNASTIAHWLARHPAVARVHYPGLEDHPDHELAKRQQRGFGGMLSFELRNSSAVPDLVTGLERFSLAESLGGVESLIAHPATMTHAAMDPAARAAAGITDALIRLSVGIEHVDDLLRDLDASLTRLPADKGSEVSSHPCTSAPDESLC